MKIRKIAAGILLSLTVAATGAAAMTLTACSQGEDGKSAYEIWLEAGNTGTEDDFLEWLKGQVGAETTEEGTDGLEYYPLDDGTYGVGVVDKQFLSKIVIPNMYKGKAVTAIVENGFYSSTHIKEITIPDSITSIGNSAFSGCTSLTNITIPESVTSICNWAFNDCTSLTSIIIPDSVTSIGNYVFYESQNLIIYCEAESQPEGWRNHWNGNCEVVWGYKGI